MTFKPRTGRTPPPPPPRFLGAWEQDRAALSAFLEQLNRTVIVESGLGDPTYQYGAYTPVEGETVDPTASTIATAQATANAAWSVALDNRERLGSAEESITTEASRITTLEARTSTLEGDVTQALDDAATAQATADGKIQSFYQTTAPAGAAIGDLWFDTDDGNHVYRWNGTSWVDAQDSLIATALGNAATAQATADGKVTSFFQTTAPTAEGLGDLWFDTDDGNRPYRWNGTSWVEIADTRIAGNATAIESLETRVTTTESGVTSNASAITELDARVTTAEGDISGNATAITGLDTRVTAAEGEISTNASSITSLDSRVTTAQATADGKVTSFFQATAPTAQGVGDLWFDTDDGNRPYRWDGTSWVDAADTRIAGQATAISSLDTRVTTAEGNITSNATAITTLDAQVNDPTTGLPQTRAELLTEQTARADADTALASDITTLETTVGNNSASITSLQTSVDGVSVKFGVTGTINGTTGGFEFSGIQQLDGSVSYGVEIQGNLIVSGSITSSQLQVGAVGTNQLASGAVTNDKLGAGSVSTGNIASFAVDTGQMANLAVSHNAFTSSSGALSGSTSLTINISVSGVGAKCFAMGTWAQIYDAPSTHTQYEGYLYINGTVISSAGGQGLDITNTISGAADLGTGSHTIELGLFPGTNVRTANRILSVWILKK